MLLSRIRTKGGKVAEAVTRIEAEAEEAKYRMSPVNAPHLTSPQANPDSNIYLLLIKLS